MLENGSGLLAASAASQRGCLATVSAGTGIRQLLGSGSSQFSNGDDSSPKSLQGIRDMSGDVFNHNWGISMPWVFTEMTGGKIFVFI